MRWLFCAAAAAALPVCGFAQFFGLATPADGSRVFFATPSRLKESTQNPFGKIFRYDASGVSLVEARSPFPLPAVTPPPTGQLTNAFDLTMADVSADGRAFAIAGERRCAGSDVVLCSKQELFTTTITAPGQSGDYPGMLRLSANGQWAFGAGSQSNPPFFRSLGYRVNLATGETRPIQWEEQPHLDSVQVSSSGRSVSDSGTAVFCSRIGIGVLQGGQLSIIPVSDAEDAVIDAAGSTIVFSAALSGEVRTATPGGSGSSPLAKGYAPAITGDGKQVLYLSGREGSTQIYVIGTDGTGDRRLTNEPDEIARATVSGDGMVAYAVTNGGRVIQIQVLAGTVRELIPASPYIGVPGNETGVYWTDLPVLAPNKVVTLPAIGVAGEAEVRIQGMLAKVTNVAPGSVTVVVPPGATPDPAAIVQVIANTATPFEGSRAALVRETAPEFLPGAGGSSGLILAAHEDWSGLISQQSPAKAGEVVHAYATGLGGTNPVAGYGEPAPSQEPLARLATPLVCTGFGRPPLTTVPLDILYAGLAPGLVGIFQIDFRVPAEAPTTFLMTCTAGGNFTGTLPVRP